MGSVPFALSIHHFINTVGSDAGFASIIGLAILVLLYFAQARETSTLRQHAAEAAERIQHLEARVTQLLRQGAAAQQVAPAPPPAAAPPQTAGPIVASRGPAVAARAAAPAGAVAMLAPAAPAGVGAPALTAATKLIPTPLPSIPAPEQIPAPVAAAPVALREFETELAPAPATAAAANGHSGPPPPVFDHSTSLAAANGPTQPPPRVQIRPGQAPVTGRRASAPSRGADRTGRPNMLRRVIAAVVGALVVAGIVIGLLSLTSGGGGASKTSGTSASRASNAPTKVRHSTPAVNPATVTVSVLNGTATTGLAHRVVLLLGGAGYKQGASGNAPDQTHTTTVVAYLPGFRGDAVAVARALKLPATSVAAIDQTTQQVACPAAPAPCTANVVVTVGADLNGTP